MGLALTPTEHLARARADFRMGAAVVLCTSETRYLAASAESVTPARFAAMQAAGQLQVVITNWRAETLKTWPSDGDIARLDVPADRGLDWIHSVADPADDLNTGMRGPFNPVYGGDPSAHRAALAIAKQAHLLPAAIVVEIGDGNCGGLHSLDLTLIEDVLDQSSQLHHISDARVPLSYSKNARVHVFRPEDGGEEHYAIEIGKPARDKPVLSRLHSACFTGDLIGSLKCDCGQQLHGALSAMGAAESGVLLYMQQEGRGIGLANKMRAYSLQDQGFDTVEANHRLGFEDDERDFALGSQILRLLGFSAVRLMTNNPAKVATMQATGISVAERVPLKIGANPLNKHYLEVKATKSGHIL